METRIRILKDYTRKNKTREFSDDMYEYLAQKLPDNPRILIGAINRLAFGIRSGAYECEGGLTRQIVDRELEYTIND